MKISLEQFDQVLLFQGFCPGGMIDEFQIGHGDMVLREFLHDFIGSTCLF